MKIHLYLILIISISLIISTSSLSPTYAQNIILLEEDFNSGNLPIGWQLTRTNGNQDWAFGVDMFPHDGSKYAYFNDYLPQTETNNYIPPVHAQLHSAPFDMLGYESILLTYNIYFSYYYYDYFAIYLVSDSDTNLVKVYQGDHMETYGFIKDSIDLSPYKHNNSHLIFDYDDNGSWGDWVYLDNIEVIAEGMKNESCTTAIPLSLNAPCTLGNNIAVAWEGELPSCFPETSRGVWYTYTATENSLLTLDISHKDSNDTPLDNKPIQAALNDVLTVFEGTCGNMAEVACSGNQDTYGFDGEKLLFKGIMGKTYYIRVSGADCTLGSIEGDFCIALHDQAPIALPSNNRCANAINLVEGNVCYAGNIYQAQATQNQSCSELPTPDVWFSFINYTYKDSLLISTMADFADVVTVYKGAGNCLGLQEIACESFACSNDCNQIDHNLSLYNLNAGIYYVQLSGAYPSIEGNYCIAIHDNCLPDGMLCDDGDPATYGDTADGQCNCIGIPCPPAGVACDDGDPGTTAEVYDGQCNCIGTPCPTVGTPCDDGNPSTVNDVEDGACNCLGEVITPICPDNLTLNQTIISGSTESHEVSDWIVATNIVEANAMMTCDAGNRVRLLEGFNAQPGSQFHAFIDGCQALAKSSTAEEPDLLLTSPPIDLRIYPNPTFYNAIIEIRLNQATSVTVNIYNATGQLIQQIITASHLDKGSHRFIFQRKELPSGTYFCQIQSNQEQKTVKLLVL